MNTDLPTALTPYIPADIDGLAWVSRIHMLLLQNYLVQRLELHPADMDRLDVLLMAHINVDPEALWATMAWGRGTFEDKQ
jgi:hypothetical protein